MYARLITNPVLPPAAELDPMAGPVAAAVGALPGFAGIWLCTQIGGPRGAMLTHWHTEQDATLLDERLTEQLGPPPFPNDTDRVFEVEDVWTGLAAGVVPTVATLVFFDGPLGDARLEAARRAGRERINPLLLAIDGLVGGFVLWHEKERAMVAITLATSEGALEEAARRVTTSDLLPGEDPALLTGPDRIEIHRVALAVTK